MPEVLEYFVDGGHRPGFPGNHGPGVYLVDYENRTIRPKPVEQDEQVQEETPVESHPDANTEVSIPEPEEQPVQPVEEAQPTEEGAEPVPSE